MKNTTSDSDRPSYKSKVPSVVSQQSTNNHTDGSIEAGTTVCSEHNRPKEIFCLDPHCFLLVCANCALFGKHKGHKLKQENEVISLTNEMIDEVKSIHKFICDSETRLAKSQMLEPWIETVRADMRSKQKEITDHFDVQILSFRV